MWILSLLSKDDIIRADVESDNTSDDGDDVNESVIGTFVLENANGLISGFL